MEVWKRGRSRPLITPRWDSAVPHPANNLSRMTGEHIVYVVDRDSSARHGLVRLLAKAGFDVKGCSSMKAYLTSFEGQPNGCLVLDASTFEVVYGFPLDVLRERNGLAGILVIAAGDDSESRDRARSVKAEAFFRKPVDGTALLDAVRWVLR